MNEQNDPNGHCAGKTPYLTWDAAHKVMRHMRVKRRPSEGKVGPYRCRFCSAWHLGHGARR